MRTRWRPRSFVASEALLPSSPKPLRVSTFPPTLPRLPSSATKRSRERTFMYAFDSIISASTAVVTNPIRFKSCDQGPITKSIRLLAALSLRNLAKNCDQAKKLVHRISPFPSYLVQIYDCFKDDQNVRLRACKCGVWSLRSVERIDHLSVVLVQLDDRNLLRTYFASLRFYFKF